MYLNDARDVAVPRKIQEQPKLDPKLLAWYQESGNSGRGHNAGKRQLGYSPDMVCLTINGRHACYDYRDYCPLSEGRVYVHQQEAPISFTRRVA